MCKATFQSSIYELCIYINCKFTITHIKHNTIDQEGKTSGSMRRAIDQEGKSSGSMRRAVSTAQN
jgi:hypothetical protein